MKGPNDSQQFHFSYNRKNESAVCMGLFECLITVPAGGVPRALRKACAAHNSPFKGKIFYLFGSYTT